ARRRSSSHAPTRVIPTPPRGLVDVGRGTDSRTCFAQRTTLRRPVSAPLRTHIHVVRPRCPDIRSRAGTDGTCSALRHAYPDNTHSFCEIRDSAWGTGRAPATDRISAYRRKRAGRKRAHKDRYGRVTGGLADRVAHHSTTIDSITIDSTAIDSTALA